MFPRPRHSEPPSETRRFDRDDFDAGASASGTKNAMSTRTPGPRILRIAAWFALVQVVASSSVDAQMAGLRTERLADSVYAVVRTTRPADPSDANTLIIINATDVVVVDGNITPRSTRAVIAEIRDQHPSQAGSRGSDYCATMRAAEVASTGERLPET